LGPEKVETHFNYQDSLPYADLHRIDLPFQLSPTTIKIDKDAFSSQKSSLQCAVIPSVLVCQSGNLSRQSGNPSCITISLTPIMRGAISALEGSAPRIMLMMGNMNQRK
jgi:hypothetical protein